MIYFIFWVIFLLAVALAVPVVSYLEKRKLAAAYSARRAMDDDVEEEFDEDVDANSEVDDFEGAEVALDSEPAGDDDFGDFEDLK